MLQTSLLSLGVILFISGYANSLPAWQTLRVTFGSDLMSPRFFAKLPTTESRARNEGFTKISGSCKGGKFLGHRYMKGSDRGSILIFDVNGFIAGIQLGIPQNSVSYENRPSFERLPAFQKDKLKGEEEVYFLTAYFVNPRIICNGGRTREQYLQDGTGTGLYIQNGTDPIRNSVKVPMTEKDIERQGWVRGQCVKSMGMHYWHNFNENMRCSDMFPFAAIYNNGKLTTFAFIVLGRYTLSTRFENPPLSFREAVLPIPMPKCVVDEYKYSEGFSGMHVYFIARPWNLVC